MVEGRNNILSLVVMAGPPILPPTCLHDRLLSSLFRARRVGKYPRNGKTMEAEHGAKEFTSNIITLPCQKGTLERVF